MNPYRLAAALMLLAAVAGCAPTAGTNPPLTPGSTAPSAGASAQPSTAPAASPAASPAAATGGLLVAAGKKYHYKYTPENIGYVDFELLTYSGNTATYSGKTVIINRPEQIDTNKTATLQNGVFWTSTEPNPVTKDINSYPEETVTVKAGTYNCRKVPSADGKAQHWFAGPLIVKAVNGPATLELVSVE